MQGQIDKTQGQIDKTWTGLQAQIDRTRTELQAQIDKGKAELQADVLRSEQRILQAIAGLRSDMQRMGQRLERLEAPLVRS